jgi:hypothetical protein
LNKETWTSGTFRGFASGLKAMACQYIYLTSLFSTCTNVKARKHAMV